jgi:uncharacterized protein (DUF2267 family)
MLLAELDLPRIHVMAEGNRVLLHGEVDTIESLERIEAAVRNVAGVETIGSYLRVGLLDSDSRPSSGHVDPSKASRRLRDALVHTGISGRPAELALEHTLRLWTQAIPEGERAHVMSHLPDDVKAIVRTSDPRGDSVRGSEELIDLVVLQSGLTAADGARAVSTIVHELHDLVPQDCDDVAAALPLGLRPMWV